MTRAYVHHPPSSRRFVPRFMVSAKFGFFRNVAVSTVCHVCVFMLTVHVLLSTSFELCCENKLM